MIRRQGRFVLTLALLLALAVFPGCLRAEDYAASGLPLTDVTVRTEDGKDYVFRAEVARTAEEMAKGLMFRTQMPAHEGMLFVFGSEAPRAFWMKNTFIPLDIIFINADGAIRTIHSSVPALSLEPRPSGGPVAAALELNGGTAARLGIRPGDFVYNQAFLGNKIAP